MSKTTKQAEVFNQTDRSIEQILSLVLVGRIRNNWRGRMIDLFCDPMNTGMLYMVGRTFDLTKVIITHETAGMNERQAVDYWKHGEKVLIRD